MHTCMPVCRCVHMSTDTCGYQGIECPGAGVTGISDLWAKFSGPWQEQSSLFTAKPSLQPPLFLRTSILSQM